MFENLPGGCSPSTIYAPCAAGPALAAATMLTAGCTSVSDYVHNGFKVGPNYSPPPAAVAKDWIDATDVRDRKPAGRLEPLVDRLQRSHARLARCYAYRQNLSLRAAGFRVLEARAQIAIDVGNIFPQTQAMTGDYTRNVLSQETANGANIANRWYSQWDYGFNLSWELDFWGRFRRTVEADRATLDASVASYDDVLVTLLGDVATNYTQYRTTAQRIQYAQENVALERKTLQIAEGEYQAGVVGELDVDQARSTAGANRGRRSASCRSPSGSTPTRCVPCWAFRRKTWRRGWARAHPHGAAGSGHRHSRRPAAAPAGRSPRGASGGRPKCAQIGIAQAELYPHIAINGGHRRLGPEVPRSLPARGPGGQRRPVVHLEHPQLWADSKTTSACRTPGSRS